MSQGELNVRRGVVVISIFEKKSLRYIYNQAIHSKKFGNFFSFLQAMRLSSAGSSSTTQYTLGTTHLQ